MDTTEPSVAMLVIYVIALVLLLALLIVDIRYIRASRKLAQQLELPKGQWLRPVKTLVFDPVIELLVIGVVLFQDVIQNWEHMLVGAIGAVAGIAFGHYRYRIQYVRALPEYKAIIFVRSRAEYIALGALVLLRFAAEQHRIPVVGALTLLITALLALIVFESIGRAWFSYRRYKQDVVAA
jgi:hypothetical protein